MITFDLVNRVWRDAGHDGRLRAERHRHRRPAAGAGRPRRRGLDGPGDAGDRAVPRGHGGAADHPADALRRRGRVDPGDRRARSSSCSTTAPRTGWTTAPATSTSTSPRRPGSATSPTCPAPQMLALFAERGGDPRSGRQARPARPAAVARRPRRRAGLGRRRARPGPARLAHRVRGRSPSSLLGDTIDVQGGGNDLLFPHHECSAAHAEVLTGEAPFAAHYVHAGMIGLDGEKMSKSQGQPGLRLPAARRRRRPDGGAAGPARRPLPRRPAVDRRRAQGRRSSGWPAGGEAAAAPAGPVRRRAAGRGTRARSPTTWTPRARSPWWTLGRRHARRTPPTRRPRWWPPRGRPARRPAVARAAAARAALTSGGARRAGAHRQPARRAPALSAHGWPAPGGPASPPRRAPAAGAATGGRRAGARRARQREAGVRVRQVGARPGISYSSVSVVIGPGQVAWATSIGRCSASYATCSRCSTGVSGRICRSLRLLPAGLPGADLVGGGDVPAPGRLLGLLVERAAERLRALQRWCRRRREAGTRRRPPRPARRRCAPRAGVPPARCRRGRRTRRRPRAGAGARPTWTRCWRYRAARSVW